MINCSDLEDVKLNRDNQLLPFWRAKKSADNANIAMHTAEFIEKMGENDEADYFHSGITSRYEVLSKREMNCKAFVADGVTDDCSRISHNCPDH